MDHLADVTAVRVYLDIDAATNNFLQNYFMFEWRANDILAAISSGNSAGNSTLVQAANTSVANTGVGRAVGSPGTSVVGLAVQNANAPPAPIGSPSNPVSGQLALGNNQWVELTCRIGDLLHIGTDPSRTLANIAAMEIVVAATTTSSQAIIVDYNALYIRGGYGPDVGSLGDPYVWAYRYRSCSVGVVSNMSPPSRGLLPRRQRCLLTAAASGDSQADTVDWFRIGGGLGTWTYVGTGPNSTATFNDDTTDSSISGGETPPFDDFQPWPSLDLARKGTCNVAGNALQWVSGDTFNTNWAPGALVLVNGMAASIQQVISSTVLLLAQSVGSGSGVFFHITAPEILGTPLPALWGPYQVPGGGSVIFATGDTNNPGTLYWTKPNNPDVTSDANSLIVTSGAETLLCGWLWDERAFVASGANVWEILPDYARPGQFLAQITPCGRGPFTPWAFTVAPEGVYFVARDGVFLTAGGSTARSISDPDLTLAFPHDAIVSGVEPPYTGVLPPDYTQVTRLRLTYANKFLYLDYRAIGGADRTLVYDTQQPRWYADYYQIPGGVITRFVEPGVYQDDVIVSTVGSHGIFVVGGVFDAGGPIPWALWTPWFDGDDLRQKKTFGDCIVDMDPMGVAATMSVLADDYTVLVSSPTFGAGISGRTLFPPFDFNAGAGILARNLALQISGTAAAILYAWEPSWVPKVEDTVERATDWDDLGYAGAKFVQGLVLKANTYGAVRSIGIQGDGVTQITLAVQHTGESEIAYPLAAAGWTPFIAQLVRIIGTDALPWQFYGVRWVFEPAPELATEWCGQSTSTDAPGYVQVRDLVIAHQSTADLSVTLSYDGAPFPPLTIPNSGGIYQRSYLVLPALKGLSVQPIVTSTQPFRVFKRDSVWRLQSWGEANGYRRAPLFGGPSRQDGAGI